MAADLAVRGLDAPGRVPASLDEHAVALDTLYEMFLFADPEVLHAVVNVDYLARRLPPLVSAKGNVPVLAARAIAEAVEVMPQWAENFAEHGAIQALRDRLLPVVNIKLAEECLLALRAICTECPDECLRLGVAAAVLRSSHLFSRSTQEVALNIVGYLFEDCDEADVPSNMEAASAL